MQRKFCTFELGGHLFAIDTSCVREVLRSQELTRVPLAPPDVCGLINLRGEIVTTIDLRARLGFPPRTGGQSVCIVVHGAGGVASLVVDAIRDVVELDPGRFENLLETFQGEIRRYLAGTYQLGTTLLLVLDADAALAAAA